MTGAAALGVSGKPDGVNRQNLRPGSFPGSVTYLDKALTGFLSSGFTICSLVMVMGWEQSCLLCDSQGRCRDPWAPLSGIGTSPICFPI